MPLVSRSLLAFVAVAEELHFGRAAQRLHMSQPPLSQQIRQFEREVGAVLFLRTTRSVRLTPAGRQLLDRARQLIGDADGAVTAAQRLARGETGSLTVGFTHSSVYQVLPRALRAFRARQPGVDLDLRQLTSGPLVDGVQRGRIDVALVRLSPSMMGSSLEARQVTGDRMRVVMPDDHPLAARRSVPIRALDRVPFVGYAAEESRYFSERVETLFARHEVRPEVVHRSFLPTIIALVEARIGLALVPASAVPRAGGALVSRPLSGVQDGLDQAHLHVVWRRDDPSPLVRRFVELLGHPAPRRPGQAAVGTG